MQATDTDAERVRQYRIEQSRVENNLIRFTRSDLLNAYEAGRTGVRFDFATGLDADDIRLGWPEQDG